MTFFEWFQDRNNITFLISVIGFILTTYQLIRNVILSRENYVISVIDYVKRRDDCIQFLFGIENRSSYPLCISEITFYGITCELERKAIRQRPSSWNFQSTGNFPLCIQAHSSQYVYVEFLDVPCDTFPHIQLCRGTTVTFGIRSTRSLAQKKLMLGDISHYLHTMAQHREYLAGRAPDE